MRTNKLWILSLAYRPWLTARQPAVLYSPKEPGTFRYSSEHNTDAYPTYFQKPFPTSASMPTRSVAPVPYTYEYTKGVVSFWADFADTFLGGGAFGNGFLQEENMCYGIPELANAAGLRWVEPAGKYTLFTRDKEDYPSPLLLRDAWRTVRITPDIYGDKITRVSTSDMESKGYVSAISPHQVNVLAMATPRVSAPVVDKQQALPVVCDLFNTFAAGFTLVGEQAGSSSVQVNSGPIGTGDFNNNIYLVYILQVAAAMHAGIGSLVLYGYEGDPGKKSEELLKGLDLPAFAKSRKPTLDLLKTIHNMALK